MIKVKLQFKVVLSLGSRRVCSCGQGVGSRDRNTGNCESCEVAANLPTLERERLRWEVGSVA